MRIVIAGSSGYLGTPLVAQLRAAGHEVRRLVRRQVTSPDEVSWRPDRGDLDPAVLDGMDAVVNLCGLGIGEHRWTTEYQELLIDSRVAPTQALAKAIAAAANPPPVLLNASAVGYYGDCGEAEIDETAPAGKGFLSELCQLWEAATGPAERAGARVVHMRSGLVLGPGGGLLGPILPLFKMGAGGKLGTGRQFMPLISRADELGAMEFLLGADVAGPVNVTGPTPVRNAEFTATLGKILQRPTLLPVPAPVLRLALGGLAVDSLASLRALPVALTRAGYRFQHDTLAAALRWALSKED